MDTLQWSSFIESSLSILPLVLTLGFTASVFAIAIMGLLRAGNGREKSWLGREEPEINRRFGIDKVSGFYGPGTLATWLFTVGSCYVDRGFGKEKRLDAKQAHLISLDLNLVAAYGYPLIAAINLLSDMGTYLGEDFTDDLMGRLAAQLVIVRTGAAIGAPLSTICTYSWWSERSLRRTAVFSIICSILLFVTVKLFELAYEEFISDAILQTVFLLPRKTRFPIVRQPLDKVASAFSHYGQNDILGIGIDLDTQANHIQFISILWFVLTDLAATSLSVLAMVKAVSIYPGIFHFIASSLLALTFGWWTYQFWLHRQFFLIFLLNTPERTVPLSSAKTTDLDQTTAAILSGLFVLLFSVKDLINRKREKIASTCQVVSDMLSGFQRTMVEAARGPIRWSGGRNIAANF
jgi:hypothetical protein